MNINRLPAKLRRMRDLVAEMQALAASVNRDVEAMSIQTGTTRADIACIQQTVADHFRISRSILMSRIKTVPAPFARHVAMFLCREMLGLTQQQVGDAFGRCHSIVEHATGAVMDRLQTDKTFARDLSEMRAAIGGRLRELNAQRPKLEAAA